MTRPVAKAVLLIAALVAATSAEAQYRRKSEPAPKPVESTAAPPTFDKRDKVVPAGAFGGRPYWLALAQCGGIYFKLNELYTEIAVQARAVKPDPKINTEYTRKLNDAINAASTFLEASANFLMADRVIEHDAAVLIYDRQSRAAGDRINTVDEALSAARSCQALYAACHDAYPKACGAAVAPLG